MRLSFQCFLFFISMTVMVAGCRSKTPELIFLNSDFESGTLEGWQFSAGNAFVSQPIKGDNVKARNRGESGHAGKYWVGTYERSTSQELPVGEIQGDSPQGILESREFVIQKKRIGFLIGGGQASELTGVGLKVNGKMVLFEPGRGVYVDREKMHRVIWDVSDWRGQKATLVVRDQASDAWGHINADDFVYWAAR